MVTLNEILNGHIAQNGVVEKGISYDLALLCAVV
jgi:hypothetical protein